MLALLIPVLGLFHLKLVRAEPAADARLTNPPRAIRIWLSERPELAVTTVRLTDGAGAVVPTGPLSREAAPGASVVAPVTRVLSPGAYTVTWRTMARDGHVVSGKFGFTVVAPVVR